MNGGCSRFNESPRWSSTGNKESIRGKRSRKLEAACDIEKREKERERERERERKPPFIKRPNTISNVKNL